jgi:hypothetical protein
LDRSATAKKKYVVIMLRHLRSISSYDKMLSRVYMEFIFNIYNRGFVSVAQEITQTNFDVICNYIEVFNMGVWGC